MLARVGTRETFVRLDPGEEILDVLRSVSVETPIHVASISSGVGMLKSAVLGFFEVPLDDYVPTDYEGPLDLSVVSGNITWRDGVPVPHVHVVFNDREMRTISGHLLRGICHITVELFLSHPSDLSLTRSKVAGLPATRILGG
jgi:predicted DNA-binding protein with PD1-like motif